MLIEKIKQDIIKSLKDGNRHRVSALRFLISEINNIQIAKRPNPLTEGDIISVLQKEAKKRKESVEIYKKAGRDDLVEKENFELKIIEEYLPEQMSEEEIRKTVQGVISSLGDSVNFGAVMGRVMNKLKGKADGRVVSQAVEQQLNSGC